MTVRKVRKISKKKVSKKNTKKQDNIKNDNDNDIDIEDEIGDFKKPPTQSNSFILQGILLIENRIVNVRGKAFNLCLNCDELIVEGGANDNVEEHADHFKYHWSGSHQPLQSKIIKEFMDAMKLLDQVACGSVKLSKVCKKCSKHIPDTSTKCNSCNTWMQVKIKN